MILEPAETFKFREAVMDFERATWKAMKIVFPSVKVFGCGFHFCQAIFKRIQKLGLAVDYARDRGVRKICRRLMSLNLLSASETPDVFYDLVNKCSGKLLDLCVYMDRNWVRENVLWNPESWSVFMQVIRTNNDVEGWHLRMNLGKAANVNLFRLVDSLFEDACLIPLQAKLLSQGQVLRQQTSKAKSFHSSLSALWVFYNSEMLKPGSLLKKCANLHLKNRSAFQSVYNNSFP